tara:strand:+ start:246 stop:536 length:291 start_codon:yes stop_codon:yes gene_type:complete
MSIEAQMPACQWCLIIKYGDPFTNEEQRTGFGPFTTSKEAQEFREQYYCNEIVIAEIVPLNIVLPESATELDVDFIPENKGNVVNINTNKINPNKH